MYIKLKDVQKPFLKLLEDFPSKEDPIMISAEKVLEIINSLPTINLQEERKKYRLIKELSTVRGVHPIGTEVFVHFNTFSGSCEIYIEDNHGSFELAYFSKSESVYEYVEEIIKKTPTQVLEEMIEEYEGFCPEITDVLKDAINKINQ